MTADRPLTRRELRELERTREREATGGVAPATEPVATESPATEPPVPAAVPQDAPAPPPTRRALREVGRALDTTSERAAVRRRPVQAPTTTGLTVVDSATGAISAIRLGADPVPEPEPVPETTPAPVSEPVAVPEPTAEPATHPSPARGSEEGGAEAPVRRRSVMGRGDDADAVGVLPDRALETAPEVGEDLQRVARRSALATILRFLVLLAAAFVIGVLIWMVADEAAADDGAPQELRMGDTR